LILIKRKQYKIYSECGNDECNAAKPGQPNTLRVAVWVGTVRAYPDLTVSNKINTSRFTSELGPGCVKTPTPNFRVERFVPITLNKKRTALAGTVERRKERKQFCAFSVRGRFHTAWVIRRRNGLSASCPV